MLKMTELFKVLTSKIFTSNNDEIDRDNGNSRADKIIKILAKSKNIKKSVKFGYFRPIYLVKP